MFCCECCALPVGLAVEYGRKFESYIFGLVFLKRVFFWGGGGLLVHTRRWPPGARGKDEKTFRLTVSLVMLLCICHASSTENWHEPT